MRLAGVTRSDRLVVAMNLAPMIGVLLAVFVVVATSVLNLEKGVNIDAPVCSMGPPPGIDWPQGVYISIQRDGQAYVGSMRMASSDAAVANAVREAREHGLRVVTIRADADVRYEVVAAVVRGLNAAGLKAGFINEEIH